MREENRSVDLGLAFLHSTQECTSAILVVTEESAVVLQVGTRGNTLIVDFLPLLGSHLLLHNEQVTGEIGEGIPVYWHSLRHFFTTSLAKANLPDSVIKTIIGWESLEMVDIYKDIDDEDEIGKYCMNGEIVGQKQAALSDL